MIDESSSFEANRKGAEAFQVLDVPLKVRTTSTAHRVGGTPNLVMCLIYHFYFAAKVGAGDHDIARVADSAGGVEHVPQTRSRDVTRLR